MTDSGEDSDVESKTQQEETEAHENETLSPRRTTRRARQRTQLYQPGEGHGSLKKRKRKTKDDSDGDSDEEEEEFRAVDSGEDGSSGDDDESTSPPAKRKPPLKIKGGRKSRAFDSDDDGSSGDDEISPPGKRKQGLKSRAVDSEEDGSSGDDEISPPVKRKRGRPSRASLAERKNAPVLDLTCPHCQKDFTVKPGLDYHIENFVCRPTLRPGGPVLKGKRKTAGTKAQTYKKIRGKLEKRTCPKCKRVFTSILGLNYHREKLVCEQGKNKTDGKHLVLDILEPGSQFVTSYGVVEVIKDDRAVPPAVEIPKNIAFLSKAWNASHTKQQVQVRKQYAMVAVKSLLRRSYLNDYHEQSLTTQKTVWKAYYGEDPRRIPVVLHSRPVKMPVPTKTNPQNPADCYPDRIVECVLIPDERNRFMGLAKDLGKKADTSQGTRMFLQRRLFMDPYIVDVDVFFCDICGKGFTSKPGCKYHMQSEVCLVKAKKAADIANQVRADIQERWTRAREKPPSKSRAIHVRNRSPKRPKEFAVYPACMMTLGFEFVATGPIPRHMSAFENKKAKHAPKQTDTLVQKTSATEVPKQADKLVQRKSAVKHAPKQADQLVKKKLAPDVPKQADKIVKKKAAAEVPKQAYKMFQKKSATETPKKSDKKGRKRSRTEEDLKQIEQEMAAAEVSSSKRKPTPKRIDGKSGNKGEDDRRGDSMEIPAVLLDDLKAKLADLTLGAMYPSVFKALGYRYKIGEAPNKQGVVKRRQRAKKPKPPPPKRPTPPIVDVRVLVKEVESGRYPSIKRVADDADHDEVCYICKKEGPLICCDFCPKAVHFDCMRRKFTLPYPEPKDDFMCNFCIQCIMARRARAEKRRLEKQGAAGLPAAAASADTPAVAATRLVRELVEGMEYECVAAQGSEVNDLISLIRDAQIRLQRHSEMATMNKIRRGLIQSSEKTAAL